MELLVTRDVTREEVPYLPRDFEEGDVIYRCLQATYGACGPDEVAATLDPDGGYPFFGFPRNACGQEGYYV